MALKYKHTICASFMGYVVQSIVNVFVPLLFVTFEAAYGISLSKITALITVNFVVQLCVDLASAFFVDKLGYRASVILAHVFAVVGLCSLTVLPELIDPFAGLLVSGVIYALGGGLLEVTVSPIVEACPTKNKAQIMSTLHSFYCWGSLAVVCLSTLFFALVGTAHWKILTLLWAVIPFCNLFFFIKVPLTPLVKEDEKGLSLRQLLSRKSFWLFFVLMACAGACELAVSQWASVFAESGLKVSKTVGDLAGPALFAALMGISRLLYGLFGKKLRLDILMLISGIVCVVSYLTIALSHSAVLCLCGVGLCGLSVGILWPGVFSEASATVKGGGTAMFALFALGGDLGCTLGPTVTGWVASAAGNDLSSGILAAVAFPVILIIAVSVLVFSKKKIAKKADTESDAATPLEGERSETEPPTAD